MRARKYTYRRRKSPKVGVQDTKHVKSPYDCPHCASGGLARWAVAERRLMLCLVCGTTWRAVLVEMVVAQE